MREYLRLHVQVFLAALGEIVRSPLASLMTIAVIGITLAFPAGLYIGVRHVEALAGGLDTGERVSVFLRADTSQATIDALRAQWRALPGVTGVEYLSPAQALAEFKARSGLGDAVDALERNPLPPTLILIPTDATRAASIAAVARAHPAVESVLLDAAWIQRLQAIVRLAQRVLMLLGVLLSLAVALIVGNTIRLAVLNRQAEIEVVKLVGGTAAFVRRPFLYSGALYGLLGGLFATALLAFAYALLRSPLATLAGLYGRDPAGAAFSGHEWAWFMAGATLLGLTGARLAVARHLRKFL